jgi:hypothetical protein
MVGLFVLTLVATPLAFAAWLVNRVLHHRLEVAQIRAQSRPALPPAELPMSVESRIQTLEDIVCSLDLDLHSRLRRADGPDHAA